MQSCSITSELLVRLGPSEPDPRDELVHLVGVDMDFTLEKSRL